ncbi:hypothetical protein LTR85_009867 [Meristemomyces frigidus]|nr:hypothetical protein LTR85_009867 [Meristemomyces frigidus]
MMTKSNNDEAGGKAVNGQPVADQAKFQPIDRTKTPPSLQLPDELWMTVLESRCTFPPEVSHGVMLNMIKNPNVTSSHLFRADIFYDTGDNAAHDHGGDGKDDLLKHLKAEYKPIDVNLPGYDLTRTIVRQLIPRNPQLDKPLVQTCHFFRRLEDNEECNVIMYVPHVQQPEDMPFYHPAVAKVAFLHQWRHTNDVHDEDPQAVGSVSVSYHLFANTALDTKLERTGLRLLQTVHKHGQGQLAGYEKRVHLDQILPQKRYQDTYTRLKATYGKQLSDQWVEVTDPGKHVFEDIGIAAFLVELWRDMYNAPTEDVATGSKPAFPGFVDIGCGNGILVYILLSEGYTGWGFDARRRRTWSIFPPHVQEKLKQQLLVPNIFSSTTATPPASSTKTTDERYHNGIFEPGTFIVSNHADELTPWTPLLAYMNNSAFIAIPCCSHDLAGARFRAPPSTKARKQRVKVAPARLPQQEEQAPVTAMSALSTGDIAQPKKLANGQAAETGTLKRTEAQKKMPSAYATLCSYVVSLAEEVGFEAEREVLRIPSTRNQCIVGRKMRGDAQVAEADGAGLRENVVRGVVEREVAKTVAEVGRQWIERAERLALKPASGH